MPSLTNQTTKDVLKYLFNAGVFAWRNNVLPVPIQRAGFVVAFRGGSKLGLPDIMGIIPSGLSGFRRISNQHACPLFIEVKTGKDKLRDEQIGFIQTATRMGAIVLVIKNFEDFEQQWAAVSAEGIKYNGKTS